jgi:hypothetical protein
VLVWLWERDVLDDRAYEMIKAIDPCFKKDEELSTLPLLWSSTPHASLFPAPLVYETWIIQEAGKAWEGLVVWGGISIDLEELLEIERGIHRRGLLTKLSLDDPGRFVAYDRVRRGLRCLETIRPWRARSADFGLLTWLYLTRDLNATDPRNKVFWYLVISILRRGINFQSITLLM